MSSRPGQSLPGPFAATCVAYGSNCFDLHQLIHIPQNFDTPKSVLAAKWRHPGGHHIPDCSQIAATPDHVDRRLRGPSAGSEAGESQIQVI